MSRKIRFLFPAVFIILALLACNSASVASTGAAPVGTALVQTMVAQTVAAAVALPTQAAATPSATPLSPSDTLAPSATPIPPTATSLPSATPICDEAAFITDVTVPDGTVFAPGAAFTKTWRLQNAGACIWNSSYALVFDHGNALGGPASVPFSGNVVPGAMVDLSVNLQAPAAPGTYTGYWKLRNASGVLFGLGASNGIFLVKITVPAATSHSLTLSADASQGGAVDNTGAVIAFPNVGDTETNAAKEGFISFNISSIPTNATITQVQMDLSAYDILSNPFSALGCLKVYPASYTLPLNSSAYQAFPAPANEYHDWCSEAKLKTPTTDNNFSQHLQTELGVSVLRFRLQFEKMTNTDAVADMVRFATVKLYITYTTP